MATLTKGKTFANGELVTPQKLHELVDLGMVSGIVNADISVSAAIADTKLAQITTANKVAQSAVANLTTDLAGKAAASHAHTIANVTGLQTALDGKQASGSYAPATGIAPSAITGTAVVTTDSRLSDARTPTSHTHGNLTNAGAIGSTSGAPIITGTSGVLQAGSFGTTAGTFCQGNDSRLSDARTPVTHTHAISDTTGLQAALDDKQAAGSYAPATGIAPSAITGTAVVTTDSRLSDARTPTSHTHGNLTNAGAIGATANLPVVTTTSGVLTTVPAGTAGQVLTSNGGTSAPSFQTLAATSTNANNLTGGSAGTVPYQSAAGTTAMLAAGTSGQVLRSNGAAAPSWLSLAASATTDTTNAANIASGTLANARTTATSANTASAIVARNASGNFSAGSITGDAVNSSFGAIKIGRGSGNDATNTALGGGSPLSSITDGLSNTALGYDSQKLTTSGDRNVSVGQEALYNNTTGSSNVAIGTAAGNKNSGSLNTAIGDSAAYNNTGVGNTALGALSLNLHTTANNSTAIGYAAGSTGNFTNSTCLGYTADVTANNQVQLGNSSTTTFAYGAVQNRSDERDKADIRPTVLGLDFIKAIQPVDFKWDFREDYRPAPPQAPGLNATQSELDEYASAKSKYLEDIKFVNLTTDGTHKRTRYHHGVIAQQVKQVIDLSGVDFGGFQDHKIGGGDDVLSMGYLEFIAPLIKAIQELAARVEALEATQP